MEHLRENCTQVTVVHTLDQNAFFLYRYRL